MLARTITHPVSIPNVPAVPRSLQHCVLCVVMESGSINPPRSGMDHEPPGQGWTTNRDTADGHNHPATKQMIAINVAGSVRKRYPNPEKISTATLPRGHSILESPEPLPIPFPATDNSGSRVPLPALWEALVAASTHPLPHHPRVGNWEWR